ncbi:MAG: DapH/DapD/GlmU-related protein [Sulfurimonas sp.]|nr:DapH/DapD/GlmU-related protein [Sulfurimonas sp.]
MNQIDSTAKISSLCDIEISKKGSMLIIGADSMVDSFVKIKFTGGLGNIEIGSNVYINSGTVLYSGNGITIGDNVLIGPNCSITPTNHEFSDRNKPIREQGFKQSKGGVIIEDDVWIGANVVILDGAIIRHGAVIGANSLVNSEIEEYSINYGTPCRKIGYRKE